MAVSLVSTGVQFPDSTIQTTAATAGGTTTGTASGSISAGFPVIVNSDGTFSAVSGANATNGTPSNPASSSSYSGKNYYAGASDPSTGVSIVVAGNGTNTFAYAVTVSGTTITWGSGVSPASNAALNLQQVEVVALGSNKFLFAYQNATDNYGYVSVCTVSGTTITMGTPVKIDTVNFLYANMTLAYNAATGTSIVTFRSQSSPYYPYIAVVSVSGTTPSVGTPVSYTTEQINGAVVYNSTLQRVILYWPTGTTGYPSIYGAVLSMSGSTVSVGTSTIYQLPGGGGGYAPFIEGLDYNAATQTVILTADAYFFGPGGYYTHVIASTQTTSAVSFSGSLNISSPTNTFPTSGYVKLNVPRYCSSGGAMYIVSFGVYNYYLTYAQVNVSSAGAVTLGTAYIVDSTYTQNSSYYTGTYSWDPSSKKYIRAMYASLGANYAAAIAFNPPYTTASANGFLGLSAGSYTNGQTATITVIGGVNASVSGLTPGNKYYLNYDGTLSTSPNNPANIYAGLSTATTKIVVKG